MYFLICLVLEIKSQRVRARLRHLALGSHMNAATTVQVLAPHTTYAHPEHSARYGDSPLLDVPLPQLHKYIQKIYSP